ncbi:hypothetical protein CI238_11192 [Colletotrichum incanum]|uniref:Uncharacterized protein n=1 Tax=Colletotrichum incanum TaxID=1573173 RepID=A0A166N614_COLIC|nr:hypothetical protein CI238_11192 [Colletotrichum incanum]
MPKLPTPSRCRRRRLRSLRLRFCDILDNSFFLKWALEFHQKPFPPPGLPYLDDEPAWKEYLGRKTPAQKKTKKKIPESKQKRLSEDQTLGVVFGHFEFSVAAATRLLDSGKGPLVVRNPDRLSLHHGDLEASIVYAGVGSFSPHVTLTVRNPDVNKPLPEEQADVSDTTQDEVLSQEPVSPTSPLYQPFELGQGRGCAPRDDSRNVNSDECIFFWPPETAQAALLLPRPRPRLVTVRPPPPQSSPAPLYRTSLGQKPRRRGVIFSFI